MPPVLPPLVVPVDAVDVPLPGAANAPPAVVPDVPVALVVAERVAVELVPDVPALEPDAPDVPAVPPLAVEPLVLEPPFDAFVPALPVLPAVPLVVEPLPVLPLMLENAFAGEALPAVAAAVGAADASGAA